MAFRQPQNDPWPVEKIAELFNQESGKHFDPRLVTLMLKRVPELHKNNAQYQDTE